MSILKAGFSRVEITPEMGVPISGYYVPRQVEGVLDPLFVNGLAFTDGENTTILLVCDLLGLYGSAPIAQELVAAEMGIPKEAVFITNTHTHTGGNAVYGPYFEFLKPRLVEAAKLAFQDMAPVTKISAGEDIVKEVTFVRRFLMDDGHYQTWAKDRDPHIVNYETDGDESMRVVRFERENKKELLFVNYQVHPDNVGGNLVSADFIGTLRDEVEAKKPDCYCVFFQGAEGQLINTDFWHGTVPKSIEKANKAGHLLAEGVFKLLPDLKELPNDCKVRFGSSSVVLPTKRDPKKIPVSKRIIELHEAGRDKEIFPPYDRLPLVAQAYKYVQLEKDQMDEITLTETFMTVGPLAFAGIPGEPFAEIGIITREGSPYPVTFLCALTNGAEGYFPTKLAYEHGGYEPRNSFLKDGAAELLAEAAVEGLKEIYKKG